MPDTAQWVAIIIALLTGSFFREVGGGIRAVFGKVTGRATERRSELTRAWDTADDEARKRRIAEEHASHVRRILIEAPCVDNNQVPPYPTYSSRKD